MGYIVAVEGVMDLPIVLKMPKLSVTKGHTMSAYGTGTGAWT